MQPHRISFALVLWASVATPVPGGMDDVDVGRLRVRVEWGGGPARTWAGLVSVHGGNVREVIPLGVDADTAGTLWTDRGAVWVQRRSSRTYDGFDAEIEANPEAVIRLTLRTIDDPPLRTAFEVPVAKLVERGAVVSVGDAGDRVIVRRAPGDELVLRTDRPHLVFDPGESFDPGIAVRVRTAVPEEHQCRLSWRITPTHGKGTNSRGERDIRIRTNPSKESPHPITVTMPDEEGAYELRVSLASGSLDVVERFPFVVASTRGPGDEAAVKRTRPPRLVDSFVPGDDSPRRIRGRRARGTLRRAFRAITRVLPFGGDEPAEVANWRAYELRVDRIDVPHDVVVSFAPQPARTIAVTLLQPNAAGALVPVGVSMGTRIDGDGVGARQRIPFWPLVERPVLLLHTLEGDEPTGAVRVEVRERPPAARSSEPLRHRRLDRRIVGPYLHKPLIPEAFAAPEVLDVETGRSLDDWRTFDIAARRLASHLHATGSNGAMIAVMADGGTIFPSEHLQPSLRYDTGRHSTGARDPIQKDVVELLLRRMHGEGLALVPTLRFTTALPFVERIRARDPLSGVILRDRDGRAQRDVRPRVVPGADYNPLHPDVQAAVLGVVGEFARRYARHESLVAVAVELVPDGCLTLPGEDWGLDDETITRFAKATDVRLAKGDDDEARASRRAAVLGAHRERWNEWRRSELTAFHERIARAITEAHPELACALVVDAETPVPGTASLGRLERTRIVQRSSPGHLPERLPGRSGFVGYTPPRAARIAAFDAISPWQPAFTWTATHVGPSTDTLRAAYFESLRDHDAFVFHGGWLPLLGRDEETRDVRAAIASLPATRPVEIARRAPVRVLGDNRQGTNRRLLVLNDSPLACTVTLRGLDDETKLSLGPFGFEIVSAESAGSDVEVVAVDVAPEDIRALHAGLDELDAALEELGRAPGPEREPLVNPGFELASAEASDVPGWSIRNAAGFTVDASGTRTGRGALLLSSSRGKVAGASTPVTLDGARHVRFTVWLRTDSEQADARLVFAPAREGPSRAASAKVDSTWQQFEFRIDDVSPDVHEAEVRLEIRDGVRIWIDDVDVRLARVTREELQLLETTSAAARLAMSRENYADAARLLNGPCRRLVAATTRGTSPPKPVTVEGEPERRTRGWRWPWPLER